jgi:inner membrane protein
MHSFLALIILSALVGVILPTAMPYFAVAFISHLATDLFNFKRVRLLYPLKGGISFHMFHAKGIANSVIFLAGSVVSVAAVVVNFVRIMGR